MLYTPAQVENGLQIIFRYLIVTETDHVLTIRLNRPEKKNALNTALLNELAFVLAYAHYTPDIWIVVLAAEGNVFCAGMDLKSLSRSDGSEGNTEIVTVPEPSGPVRLGELMAGLHKPCIGQIQGPVLAGGFLLVAGCTHVVAVESATFSLPEVKRGLFPFQVMASLLEIMPARTAMDWCLRGRKVAAPEALALGLVTDVVINDHLETALANLVDELKQFSPTAMQFGLRAYQQLKSLPRVEWQAFLHEQFQQIQQTHDAKEGMAAFLEKRDPKWG
ncbi:MAG: enoyl-CoA hydratase/isomerase family protein [Rudanella sp.]|nr:enoyl-CoA hydratase/isomerase family protein [Rudanella sp.]